MLRGVITALITPMDESDNIDFASVKKMVEEQIKSGVAGLVVAGTTGEGALLDNNEKTELINQVIAINQKRVKIIVGLGLPGTKLSCDYINNYLNKITGIDYILALTPCYVKPNQDGLYQYFKEIARSSIHPIILYNVPGRTGCDLHNDTVIKLAQDCKNIIGLKDATGEIKRGSELIAGKPEGFLLYSGDDKTALQFMINGGDGVISVISNIIPDKISKMCALVLSDRYNEKNKNEAKLLDEKITTLNELLFVQSNPIPVKWAAFALGLIKSPVLRSPLTKLTPLNQKKLAIALESVLGYEINV